MTDTRKDAAQQLKTFEAHYQYDASYLFDLLEISPTGFDKFVDFMPLSQHREDAPIDAHFIAHLIATRSADCGPCLELVTKMAKEAGVPQTIIDATLSTGDALPDELKLVRSYALAVVEDKMLDPELFDALKEHYSETTVAELALTLATATVYPTLKRALGKAHHCSIKHFQQNTHKLEKSN